MTIPQEQLSDEDLASKISEDGILSQDSTTSENDGILETGIHGNASMIEGESDPALQEEPFLTDDFEEDVEQDIAVESNDDVTEPAAVKDADTSAAPSVFTSENSTADEGGAEVGEVAEFRKTLSALSKQLEIDRLTLLYKHMKEEGKPLPNLGKIASDIRGDSQLQPIGDEDLYSKRPLARLQGWIAGLSFGIGRRAKKFPR